MGDLFDVDTLLPELVVGLGLALVVGNGLAWWKHRRGEAPAEVDEARFRAGRALFLLVVGLVVTVWGLVSLFD